MTEKTWFDHPLRAIELNAALNDPVLIDALEVLTSMGLQPIGLPQGSNASLMEFYALNQRWRDGYLECIANLKLLAKPKLIKPRDETSWTSSPDKYEEAKRASELKPEPIKFD